MTEALAESPKQPHAGRIHISLWVISVIALVASCAFQLWWFSRTCFNEIDFDGLSYVGIARHLREGEFHAAINSFRSPLISWLMAALSFGGDYLHIGKLITIASFLACVILLYALTQSLWHSHLAAALAALLFTLGRGLAAAAVESITPDFLFAALGLVYCLLLLRALRKDRLRDWFLVGAAHGVAFLAKTFALPWLAVCTVAALALSAGSLVTRWKPIVARFALAAAIPAVVAAGWAAVLHSKYGVYTAGNQFRLNMLQWILRAYDEHRAYTMLTDNSEHYDEYVVFDAPRGSWMWTYHIGFRRALPRMIRAEMRNLPKAAKELTIVETPGGLLAFLFALAALARRRRENPNQTTAWRFCLVAAIAGLSLLIAYSMLVIDPRYLYPLMALTPAVSAGFLADDGHLNFLVWRRVCLLLVLAGFLFSLTYWASPFRTLTRDFQLSCYDAGNHLKAHPGSRIISLGSGPFPEHGVGWEAGFKTAYFGGRRIVATMDSLPDSTQLTSLMSDIQKASPDAILVWCKPDDARRAGLLQRLALLYPHRSTDRILDPALGEVGVVVYPEAAAGGT